MAHSSLLGIDRAATGSSGHDTASLGPSDTSDSGSDLAGLETFDDDDSMVPVDVAIANDRPHPDTAVEAIEGGADSDAAGTGERRGAGGESHFADGADIAPDRIVTDPDSGALEDDSDLFSDESQELLAAVSADDGEDAEADDESGQLADESDAAIRPRKRRPAN